MPSGSRRTLRLSRLVPEPADDRAKDGSAPIGNEPRVGTQSPWVRTSEPLLWFGGAGHELRGPDYFWDSVRRGDRPHVTLQLTLAGVGFYDSRRGGRQLVPPGYAWIDVIPGPFRYGYARESPSPHELVFVSLTGAVANRWLRRIVRAFGHVLNLGTIASNPVAPLMLSMADAHDDNSLRDRYLASARLYTLMMTVFSTLTQSRVTTAPRMAQAVALIEQLGGDSNFGVSDLAERLDCSREHLARQFRAFTGVNPLDYLTQHRLRLAARQLRETDDKLDAVARRCGFSGANYLCRAFRKHVHVTPAQFRERPWMTVG